MKFVKFSPSILTPDDMVQQSTTTEDGITTNAAIFGSTPVTAAQLATQRARVTTKKAEQGIAAIAFADVSKELGIENETLGNMLLQVAGYVDTVAIANPATGKDTANKGGFAAVKDAVHHTSPPDAPQGFSVTLGDNSGDADLMWDATKFTQLYKVYYSTNTVTPVWVLADSTKISKIELHGLPVGVPLLFKVHAHNGNGDSAPSAVVTKTLV
jgi:hypothetical protein